jgi:hypothetical protein
MARAKSAGPGFTHAISKALGGDMMPSDHAGSFNGKELAMDAVATATRLKFRTVSLPAI